MSAPKTIGRPRMPSLWHKRSSWWHKIQKVSFVFMKFCCMEAIFAMIRAFLWAAMSALFFFSAEADAVSEEEVEASTASDA
ncbi:hypothetical protein E2C01_017426 [Portunus trituberculatus]|uniref:Uncharacterized protein n=1 Tax=Portunus trituberculatus TaxID=210409 RepID=A0A5B7DTS3_PORTR|nr:hypothetical protein [Portunus trituberculatus]